MEASKYNFERSNYEFSEDLVPGASPAGGAASSPVTKSDRS
jgi:hypothetical protein